MSRAGIFGLTMVGAGIGLVFALATGGLPDGVRSAVEESIDGVDKAVGAIAEAESRFQQAVSQDRSFLENLPETKSALAIIKQKAADIETLRSTSVPPIKALLDKDDSGDRFRIIDLSVKLREATVAILKGVERPSARVQKLLNYKRDNKRLLSAAHDSMASVPTDINTTGLSAEAAKAKADFPEAGTKIDTRLAKLASDINALQVKYGQLKALEAAPKPSYVETGQLAETITAGASSVIRGISKLSTDLTTLAYSVDKILIDMKDSGGRYYHKYRIIEGKTSRKGEWEEVSHGFYQQHLRDLGMTIYSKPAGSFADEATRVASPPGYNYVGNKRYGYWQESGGRSFWVFYGQYALMRDLFWGPSYYRPVYRRSWNSYRTNMRAGRAYYGTSNQYGTSGSRTKTRYRGSSYFAKQRKRKAREALRRSRSRYTGSSSYGGGRRSGGSRGSRYSGSSFGGRGK